jgi:hypothetical protein
VDDLVLGQQVQVVVDVRQVHDDLEPDDLDAAKDKIGAPDSQYSPTDERNASQAASPLHQRQIASKTSDTPAHPAIMTDQREDAVRSATLPGNAPKNGRLAAFNPRLGAAALRIG